MSEKRISEIDLFVIGASAGGVDILCKILPSFTQDMKVSVCIVLHIPSTGPNLIAGLLADKCSMQVKEAEPGETLTPGTVYIAPPDYHLCVEPSRTLSLSNEEPVLYSRPSIDVLFETAAYAYGKKVAAILCTGANSDGAQGLKMIQEAGGITIVQDPSDADYRAMPEAALQIMKPDYVLSSEKIAELIKKGSYAR